MSANVGLATPRGTGTSGYVQRNLSALRHKDRKTPYPKDKELDAIRHKQRQPDKQILAHDKAREIEVKVFDLRDKLEDEGVDEDEIEIQTDALRKKLQKEAEKSEGNAKGSKLKSHQVHQLAERKIEETEKLRKAFGISENYSEGDHWKRQEERARAQQAAAEAAEAEESE